MKIVEWLKGYFNGGEAKVDEQIKERLDSREISIASRLSRMKGVTRDAVFDEAYRRARVLEEEASYRRSRAHR